MYKTLNKHNGFEYVEKVFCLKCADDYWKSEITSNHCPNCGHLNACNGCDDCNYFINNFEDLLRQHNICLGS